jgi:hypothetical protein
VVCMLYKDDDLLLFVCYSWKMQSSVGFDASVDNTRAEKECMS